MINANDRITVITHTDTDGIFCGGIIKYKYPQAYVIQTNYGNDLRLDNLIPGQILFVTDFSFPLPLMKELESKYNLIWIDHHPVVDEYKKDGFEPEGLRGTNVSAAYLTWQYCFPDVDVPDIIKYVSDYDTWQNKYLESLWTFYGLCTLDINITRPNCISIFNLLFNDKKYAERIIDVGRIISEFIKKTNKTIADDCAFKTTIDNHKAIACNIKNTNSLLFASCDLSDVEVLILYSYFANINKYRVSVFSNDKIKEPIAVNEVAKKFGGGGHKGAAGFVCDELPFELPSLNEQEQQYDDIYTPLSRESRADPILNKYVSQGLIPLVLSHNYECIMGEYRTVIINNPVIDIDAFYVTGLNNKYTLGASVCLTNSGLYRYRIYVLDPSVNINEVCSKLNGHIVGNSIWVYKKNMLKRGDVLI